MDSNDPQTDQKSKRATGFWPKCHKTIYDGPICVCPDQISAIVLSNLGHWLTGPGHFQQRTADSAFFQSSNVVQKASHFSECYDIQVQKHSLHLYIVAARNASLKSVTFF